MKPTIEDWAHRTAAWLDGQKLSTLLLMIYVLSLVLSLLVGYGFSYRSAVETLDYDEWEYWQLSTSLLNGAFDDPGRRTLGYPLLLAALRLVSDNIHFIQPAVTAIAAIAPPLLAFVLLRIGASRLAAFLAGVALAFWPPHLFLAASLYSEAVALPVLLLLIAYLPKGARAGKASFALWLVCGVLLGLLAHIRTMYQLFLPVVLVICCSKASPWKRAVAGWLAVVAGFLLMVLPWSIYVSGKIGAPVLLTANGGETLAGGLTPELYKLEGSQPLQLENRTAGTVPASGCRRRHRLPLLRAKMKAAYAEQDRLLRRAGRAMDRDNPGRRGVSDDAQAGLPVGRLSLREARHSADCGRQPADPGAGHPDASQPCFTTRVASDRRAVLSHAAVRRRHRRHQLGKLAVPAPRRRGHAGHCRRCAHRLAAAKGAAHEPFLPVDRRASCLTSRLSSLPSTRR
jgi:hypothetical protein